MLNIQSELEKMYLDVVGTGKYELAFEILAAEQLRAYCELILCSDLSTGEKIEKLSVPVSKMCAVLK